MEETDRQKDIKIQILRTSNREREIEKDRVTEKRCRGGKIDTQRCREIN